jgi:hypothetical protein
MYVLCRASNEACVYPVAFLLPLKPSEKTTGFDFGLDGVKSDLASTDTPECLLLRLSIFQKRQQLYLITIHKNKKKISLGMQQENITYLHLPLHRRY